MYNVARNNFYANRKNATIMTPTGVSRFIFDLVRDKITKGVVIDPCVGDGSLLKPFADDGFKVLGIDIEQQGFRQTHCRDFIDVKQGEFPDPALVVANPPFNIDRKVGEKIKSIYGARPLLPEVWLQKIIALWGCTIPIVLFTPYGMRLNQTKKSKRWNKFVDGTYPPIASIVALPKDVYDNVLFHSEILIFNIKGLDAHYFYHD